MYPNLVKYAIAAVISLVVGVIATFMGNILSGILIFILIFGGYIMWNVVRGLREEPVKEVKPPIQNNNTSPKDN